VSENHINIPLVPVPGFAELYEHAKTLHEKPPEIAYESVKPIVRNALTWAATYLKPPEQRHNPFHFGQIVTLSHHCLRFASEGLISYEINAEKPIVNSGWIRTVKLGSELRGTLNFPEPPYGSWVESVYFKLFDSPVASVDDLRNASGVYVPVPRSNAYDPNQTYS
jgi:hypothetical protein